MLTVTKNGVTEALSDYKDLERNREVNGEISLSFLLFKTDRNAHSFDMVMEESIVSIEGQDYRIKKMERLNIRTEPIKKVEAHHVFFDLIDNYVYEQISGTKTIQQALTHALSGSGYTFDVIGAFNTVPLGDTFGSDNSLALVGKVLDLFRAEIEPNNKHLTIKEKIGVNAGVQMRYGYNIKTISEEIDTSNLATFIKGYGKKRDGTDILSGVSIPIGATEGTWLVEEETNLLFTEEIGSTLSFSFTGTGFNFETICSFLGGVWEFVIDGEETVKVSTYSDEVTKTENIEVIRELSDTEHNVIARFDGKDTKNPYTKEGLANPRVYLKAGNIIHLYRAMQPEEYYPVQVEYTSPNAAVYGIRHSPPVYDERFTDSAALLAETIKRLQDTPETSIEIDFAEMKKAGYPYDVINTGDTIYLIHEILGIDIEVRVMKISDYPAENDPRGSKITLSNLRRNMSDSSVEFKDAVKKLRDIIDPDGVIRYNVLTEAVKRATEALTNSLTQLEYPVNGGIVARDPNNPNNLVALVSNGIGISRDGGQTFTEAITSDGFVLSAGAVGELSANNIDVSGIITLINGGGYTAIDGGKIALGTNADFQQLDLDTQTALSNAETALSDAQTASGLANTANDQVNLWKYPNTTYIDGGLLFTDTVTANAINVSQLSAISGDLGYITAGNIDITTDLHVGNNLYLGDWNTGYKQMIFNSGAIVSSAGNFSLNISASTTYITDGDVQLGTSYGVVDCYGNFNVWSNKQVRFPSFGGGWYMEDTSWIRAVNNKGIYTPGTIKGVIENISDPSQKENISDVTENALTIINSVKVKQFNMINDLPFESLQWGFMADELPSTIVSEAETGTPKSIKQGSQLAHLWKAVQEEDLKVETGFNNIYAEIQSLKDEIAALKGA